ncbi:MAG TPA: hypothetical protein VKR54_04985 [Candidatus Babeliales bacterium]|jgi:hypothetical protein|nr:hypothetical protein [Candidatus Babeliales bacterium]
MLRSISTAIIISCTLMSNIGLFGMGILQQLPHDIITHIFVLACPSTQNQLKNSCGTWHAIGTKQAPNMYKLVTHQLFNPSQDDWSYIMMNAALDENIEVMKNILDRTNQRKFDCDFGGNRSFRLYDMPVIKELQEYGDWKKEAPEKFKELDFASNLNKWAVVPTTLFRACFEGNLDNVNHALDALFIIYNYVGVSDPTQGRIAKHENIYNALFMAVYNNNPHCIELLVPHCNKREPAFDVHLNLLFMAMRKQKKHAFKALVQNNVYGCLNDVMFGGTNTTTLDEICKQTDVDHLDKYIARYRKLGGKTLVELGYYPDIDYSDMPFSSGCVIS